MLLIEQLNALNRDDFATRLRDIYEHSAWIAERAWANRPFASVNQLHAAMQSVVIDASRSEQLALIRAHPELLGRLVAASQLTDASRKEQTSAGLYQCSEEELVQLQTLNRAYREKFGFPFVVAVRGLTSTDIIARMTERLKNSLEAEVQTCLNEIGRIAWFRLQELVVERFVADTNPTSF